MPQISKFQNIVDWIKSNIDGGIWHEGDRIPSENELSTQFDVSRQTVRRALDILSEEGLIQKSQGKGTFVGGNTSDGNSSDETTEDNVHIYVNPNRSGNSGYAEKDGKGNKSYVNRPVYNNIAVICTFVDNYIFPAILKGIESVISKSGHTLQLFFTNDSVYQEKTILENIIDRDNIDGLIVEPAKSAILNPNLGLYDKIEAMGIPILFFHAKYPDLKCPFVGMDDEKAGAEAVKLLLDAGHRNIAGIFHSEDEQGLKRYAGFIHELWAHNHSTDKPTAIWLDGDMISHMEKLEDYIFDSIRNATGVACYNDEVAFKLINMALKRGLRVPEDLSVVGIDDSYLAEVSEVQITSIRHPHERLGIKVGENMLKMLENRNFDGNYIFGLESTIRDSVAKIG